jgi:predicted metal-binding protein
MSDLKNKLLEIQSKLLRESKSATGISLKSVLDKVIKLIFISPGQFILFKTLKTP